MVSLEFRAPQIKAALGEVVRSHRLELGLTQEKLSFKCGIAANSISRTERGKGNLTYFNLKRLTAGLGVPASELLAYAEKIEKAELSAEPTSPAADPEQSAKAPAPARRKSAKKKPTKPRKSVRDRRQERGGESPEAAEKP
jgi:transcriptional regulator with XRE-family HTH domain